MIVTQDTLGTPKVIAIISKYSFLATHVLAIPVNVITGYTSVFRLALAWRCGAVTVSQMFARTPYTSYFQSGYPHHTNDT